MNEQTINQIKELLAPIGEKIGQGAEFGWEIVVKQQKIEAYISIAVLVVGIILALITVNLAKKSDWRGFNPRWNEIASIIFGSISIIMIMIGFVDFFDTGIGQLVNPEYYAIEFFIGLVK